MFTYGGEMLASILQDHANALNVYALNKNEYFGSCIVFILLLQTLSRGGLV